MNIRRITLSDATLVYDKGDFPKAIYIKRLPQGTDDEELLSDSEKQELSPARQFELRLMRKLGQRPLKTEALYEDRMYRQPKDMVDTKQRGINVDESPAEEDDDISELLPEYPKKKSAGQMLKQYKGDI